MLAANQTTPSLPTQEEQYENETIRTPKLFDDPKKFIEDAKEWGQKIRKHRQRAQKQKLQNQRQANKNAAQEVSEEVENESTPQSELEEFYVQLREKSNNPKLQMNFLKRIPQVTVANYFRSIPIPSDVFSDILRAFAASAKNSVDLCLMHNFMIGLTSSFKFDQTLKEATDGDIENINTLVERIRVVNYAKGDELEYFYVKRRKYALYDNK